MRNDTEIQTVSVITHYDMLIDEGNDPVWDDALLREYMDTWDGKPFLVALGNIRGKSVLEIGIGTGRLAIKIAPECKSLTGIDISPKTAERARENLASFGNTSVICDDFLYHDFACVFDVIYSSLTMMHFENKRGVIMKVAELLSSGGVFCLSIDKNNSKYIDMGTRKVRIYPDCQSDISTFITESGMEITSLIETENAYITVAKKK